ncbi:hypothetical protein K435DRAFT_806058 [Dendrothele bispora CBS 962.96]|uniref:DUF6534 domain-containing protein n=1 Tax=Dendrothele bispora (strain CBS 962.96) TaxID=1314807 RepID=A0A4S8L920_DENBC|nr:hypothetical protein K435DRAFT_806058 [Dendrothele bispora CBS 962.96]
MSGIPDRPTPISQTVFEQSYGSAFICMVNGACLYGISILQSYMYFTKYPGDSIFIKLLVSSLIYTKPQLLIEGEWSLYILFILGTVMCFLVQVTETGLNITWLQIVSSCTLFANGTFNTTLNVSGQKNIENHSHKHIVITVRRFQLWFPMQTSTSFVYSGSSPTQSSPSLFVPFFWIPELDSRKYSSGFLTFSITMANFPPRTVTTKLINTLIAYAINRYVLTTVVVFIQMVLILTIPQNKGAMAIDFVTVQLKFNSLLTTLNARNHLRRMVDHTTTDSGITNVTAPLKTRSIVQFAVQPHLQSTGSFSSNIQECSEDSIVRIGMETYADNDCSLATNVQETTENFV